MRDRDLVPYVVKLEYGQTVVNAGPIKASSGFATNPTKTSSLLSFNEASFRDRAWKTVNCFMVPEHWEEPKIPTSVGRCY